MSTILISLYIVILISSPGAAAVHAPLLPQEDRGGDPAAVRLLRALRAQDQLPVGGVYCYLYYSRGNMWGGVSMAFVQTTVEYCT